MNTKTYSFLLVLFFSTLSLLSQGLTAYEQYHFSSPKFNSLVEDSLGRIIAVEGSRVTCYNPETASIYWQYDYSLPAAGYVETRAIATRDFGSLIAFKKYNADPYAFVRLDSAGNVLWARQYVQSVVPARGFAAEGKELADSSFIVALSNAVLRIDASGNMLWESLINGYLEDIDLMGDTTIVLLRRNNRLDLMNLSGAITQSWNYYNNANDFIAVAAGKFGNLYLASQTDIFKFNPVTGNTLRKTDGLETIGWQGGTVVNEVNHVKELRVDRDGNIYTTARMLEVLPAPFSANHYTTAIGKYDTSLTLTHYIYSGYYPDSSNYGATYEAEDLQILSDGSVVACGEQNEFSPSNWIAWYPQDLSGPCPQGYVANGTVTVTSFPFNNQTRVPATGGTFSAFTSTKSALSGSFTVICADTAPPAPGVTTQLTAQYCNDTLDKLNRLVYADPAPGAMDYEFQLINPIGPDTFYYVRGSADPNFNMVWIPGIQYDATYEVRVRVMTSGAWGTWGPVCLLTTPDFPGTQLVSADCGRTLDSLAQIVYIDPVGGASNFEYELTDSATSSVLMYQRGTGNLSLKLIWIPGITNGSTYYVRVRAFAGGVWGPYGSTCILRTPASGPTTQVQAQYCGTTVSSLTSLIRVDRLPTSSNYEYELTDSASGGTLTYLRNSSNTSLRLSWITGILNGRSYFIRVRAFVNGAWTAYGSSCTVRTPGIPATQLQAAYCGYVATAWNEIIRTERVSGANGYEFEFADTASAGVFTYLRNSSNLAIRLSWVTGLMPNRVYAVRVRARVGSNFGPFGPVCYVTTPTVSMKWAPGDEPMAELDEGQPEVTVFPNPSPGDVIGLQFAHFDSGIPLGISLYDLSGKLLWKQDLVSTGGMQEFRFSPDSRLAAGTYLIKISDGNGQRMKRLIVQ